MKRYILWSLFFESSCKHIIYKRTELLKYWQSDTHATQNIQMYNISHITTMENK